MKKLIVFLIVILFFIIGNYNCKKVENNSNVEYVVIWDINNIIFYIGCFDEFEIYWDVNITDISSPWKYLWNCNRNNQYLYLEAMCVYGKVKVQIFKNGKIYKEAESSGGNKSISISGRY